MRKAHHRQRGTSLIEALVALLVLALGVMGMAAVQTRTLATARTTNLRAVAIRAAEDLQERIQANSDLRHMPALFNPYVTTASRHLVFCWTAAFPAAARRPTR